jgi:hypothetical protein
MSKFTRTESYRHENDDGPPDLGESEPYTRRHPSVRPARLVATVAKVLAVALGVGAVPAVVLLGQASGAARPAAQVDRATPPLRAHPRLASKPSPSAWQPGSAPSAWPAPMPSAWPSLAPSARPSPKPPARRKPVTHLAAPARPPVKAPARPPVKAPARPPVKAPAKPPTRTAPVARKISGHVQCTTMPMEGVWIVAKNGGSGWAKWTGITATTARYNYTLPKGGKYAVHVGCGGSLSEWLTKPDSKMVPGTVNNFLCHDVAGQPDFDFCKHIS